MGQPKSPGLKVGTYPRLKPRLSVFEERYGKWLRSAPCGLLVAIGALGVGTVGSIASTDIRYFVNAGFRGVLSIPVFRYEEGRAIDIDDAIAVLNVHWYKSGSRLEVEFACKAFVEGIRPYLLLLGELLHDRPELSPDDGEPASPKIPSKPPARSSSSLLVNPFKLDVPPPVLAR